MHGHICEYTYAHTHMIICIHTHMHKCIYTLIHDIYICVVCACMNASLCWGVTCMFDRSMCAYRCACTHCTCCMSGFISTGSQTALDYHKHSQTTPNIFHRFGANPNTISNKAEKHIRTYKTMIPNTLCKQKQDGPEHLTPWAGYKKNIFQHTSPNILTWIGF